MPGLRGAGLLGLEMMDGNAFRTLGPARVPPHTQGLRSCRWFSIIPAACREQGKLQCWRGSNHPTASGAGHIQGEIAASPFGEAQRAGESLCQELVLSHSPLEGLSGQE